MSTYKIGDWVICDLVSLDDDFVEVKYINERLSLGQKKFKIVQIYHNKIYVEIPSNEKFIYLGKEYSIKSYKNIFDNLSPDIKVYYTYEEFIKPAKSACLICRK